MIIFMCARAFKRIAEDRASRPAALAYIHINSVFDATATTASAVLFSYHRHQCARARAPLSNLVRGPQRRRDSVKQRQRQVATSRQCRAQVHTKQRRPSVRSAEDTRTTAAPHLLGVFLQFRWCRIIIVIGSASFNGKTPRAFSARPVSLKSSVCVCVCVYMNESRDVASFSC